MFTTLNTATLAPIPSARYQHRNDSEPGIAPQRAQRVAHILRQHIEERQPPRLSLLFPRLLHSAKSHHRLPPRLFRPHPAPHVLFNGHLQMRLHLRIEIGIERRFAKKGPHPIPNLPQAIHDASPVASCQLPASCFLLPASRFQLPYSLFPTLSTLPITAASRCQ